MHRAKPVPRKGIQILMAAIVATAAVPVYAVSPTPVVGAAGMNGANGTGGIGTMDQFIVTPGGNGTSGGAGSEKRRQWRYY